MSRLRSLFLLLLLLGCVPAAPAEGEPIAPTIDPISATATAAAPDLPAVALTAIPFDPDATPTPPATPTQFLPPTATPQLLPCEAPFKELQFFAEAAAYDGLAQLEQNEPDDFPQITPSNPIWEASIRDAISAGIQYLNNCTDASQPLADQPETLAQLADFYQLIPTLSSEIAVPGNPPSTFSWESKQEYQPETELLDLNDDGADELIVHTQLPFYSTETVLTIQGGLTIVFYREPASWQGRVIWPFHYFVPKAEDYLRYAPFWEINPVPDTPDQALNVRPGPTLRQLEPGYLAIAGTIFGPVDDFRELGVIRWADGDPELALDIFLANWCVNASWAIEPDGSITMPFLPEPFPHCTGEYEARLFRLVAGQFAEELLPANQ